MAQLRADAQSGERRRRQRRRAETQQHCIPYSVEDEDLRRRISKTLCRGPSATALDRIGLDRFLCETGDLPLATADRLRYLAIGFEPWIQQPQPRGWRAAKRVYRRAAHEARSDLELARVDQSAAITASHFAAYARDDRAERELLDDAFQAINRAVWISPRKPRGYLIRARLELQDPSGDVARGLSDIDEALELAPRDRWARLCRGRLLVAARRYREAVDVLDGINLAGFAGPHAKICEEIIALRVLARLRTSDRAAGLDALRKLCDRYDRSWSLACQASGDVLLDIASRELPADIAGRLKALIVRYWPLSAHNLAWLDDNEGVVGLAKEIATGIVVDAQAVTVGFAKMASGFTADNVGRLDPPAAPKDMVCELVYRHLGDSYGLMPDEARVHIRRSNRASVRRIIARFPRPSVWVWYTGARAPEQELVFHVRAPDGARTWHTKVSVDGQVVSVHGIDKASVADYAAIGRAVLTDYPWGQW